MKKTIILVTLAMLALSARGQRIHAFVSSGATLSQIEGDELKGFRMLGYTGGVGAIAALDQKGRWSLSVEALYAQRGAYNNSSDPYRLSLPLRYVDIPLMVHIQDPYGGMIFGLGLNYGRLLEQPTGAVMYNPDYFVPDTTDMTFRRNELAAVADIRFRVWSHLMLNLRWQYSLTPIKRDWHFTEKPHNGATQQEIYNNCYSNTIAIRLLWQF